MEPPTLKKTPCLKNERGLWHGFVNLAWICWIVIELPLALLYYLLVIVTARGHRVKKMMAGVTLLPDSKPLNQNET
jgi:hypothetical protein